MVKPSAHPEPKLDSKDALIAAAKKIFAEKGFDGATVKDISDEAGLNVSLVSYHFHGKEGLYRTCLEQFGSNRLAMIERLLSHAPKNAEDLSVRLTLFAEEFLEDAVREPHIHAILHRECSVDNPISREMYLGVFRKIFETVVSFFEHAQKSKLFKKKVDCQIVADLFIGGLVHMIRIDKIKKELSGETLENDHYRSLIVKNSIQLVLEGLLP